MYQAHQIQFEKELQEDYGYELTEEFRKELDDNFYCVIEDFYETVCPQASQKIQVKSLGKAGNSSSSAEERSHPIGTKRIFKESSSSSSEANIGDDRDREEVRKKQKVKYDGLKTENTNANEKKVEKGKDQEEKN